MKKLFIFLISLFCAFQFLRAQNDCATAVPITSIPFSSGIQNTCGTGNDYVVGDYCSTYYGDGEDFVYSLTISNAPVNLKFTVGGTATWKLVAVHSACPPTTSNCIGMIETIGSTGEGIISFPTNGTYYVYIDTWPSPDCGEFTLDITPPPAAPNCATLTSPANGTTTTILNPDLAWNAPATGSTPTAYKVYLGTTNPPTTLAATVNAPTTNYTPNNLLFGTTYYWYVVPTNGGSDATGCNATVWSFTTPPPPPPPANDNCSGAVTLTVNSDYSCTSTVTGTTISATHSSETAATCADSGTNDDVWYKFTATSTSHRVSLSDVTGNVTDMAMAAYSGVCGSLVSVACSDPNTMNLTGLTIGTQYYIRVWTYTSTVGSTATSFKICVGTPPPPPANDECANAVSLTPGGNFAQYVITGDTSSATNSTSLTATCLLTPTNIGGNVWYKVVVPASGNITIETNAAPNSSMTDTVLTVFDACSSTTSIGCDDDSGDNSFSKVSLTGLTAGSTIYVSVARYSSAGGGNDGTFLISAYDSSLLGVSEIVSGENFVKAHPNPFSDVLNISDIKNVKSISVMDVSGKLVKSFAKPESTLHLGDLNSGMYLVVLNMKDGSKQTIKAIKK